MSDSSSSDASPPNDLKPLYFFAWFLCALFYLYQYAVRSAPGVMQDQLTAAWGGNHIGAMISAYYVAYAMTALAAGLLLDRYGAARVIPYAIAFVGVGCLVFAQGIQADGTIGFVLQGIGAVFAFIGSSYVAARNLLARMYAIFTGLTQCLGMLGAAFGSKPVQVAIDPSGSIGLASTCGSYLRLPASYWLL
jgi:MFS family permease